MDNKRGGRNMKQTMVYKTTIDVSQLINLVHFRSSIIISMYAKAGIQFYFFEKLTKELYVTSCDWKILINASKKETGAYRNKGVVS